MVTELASRPAPVCRVWSRSKVIAEDLTGEDLSDVLELHSDASAWWILPREHHYGAAELKGVADALDLDELAIKDLLAEDRRAKFETFGQARLVITNAVTLNRDSAQLRAVPISIIATDRALICLVDSTTSFRPSQLLLQSEEALTQGGVEAALQIVIGAVINTYEDAMQWLEDATDQLADALFQERPLDKLEQLHAFRLRSALSQLRRLTDPMRAVMTDIGESTLQSAKGKNRNTAVNRRWKLLAEQHDRVANAADALREALASVFDTSLALADVRLNSIMKKLTGWAAIIAVPTLVTSFVGMNVRFPLVGSAAGFWLYLGIMVITAVALYLLFKSKDWV